MPDLQRACHERKAAGPETRDSHNTTDFTLDPHSAKMPTRYCLDRCLDAQEAHRCDPRRRNVRVVKRVSAGCSTWTLFLALPLIKCERQKRKGCLSTGDIVNATSPTGLMSPSHALSVFSVPGSHGLFCYGSCDPG